jgi:hypothetical protein
MTTGIKFGDGRSWLVSSSLAEAVLEQAAERLDSIDDELGWYVRSGLYAGQVDAASLPAGARETLRRNVVDVTRALLIDEGRLRSLIARPVDPELEQQFVESSKRSLEELLDLAGDETEPST